MEQWKSVVRSVSLLGVFGILLWLAVSYSGPGTEIVRRIAFLSGVGGFGLWLESKLKRAYGFSPFTVTIETRRAALLDHGLATVEELDELDKSLTGPERERSALVTGISFTLLSPGFWPGHNKLIYWNLSRGFSTELKGSIFFTELSGRFPADRLGGKPGVTVKLNPQLWIREGADGLEIGFDTLKQLLDREEWEEPEPVAVLPWSEFKIHQWSNGILPASKHSELLQRLGWTRGDRDEAPYAPYELRYSGGERRTWFIVTWDYI